MAKVKIPNFKLNNGMDMPALGYGTWLGLNNKLELIIEDAPKLVEAMIYAIDIGYRHFDTAHLYRVEPELGHVVRKKIEEGVVTREEIFITTKVWQHNHRPEDVEASVRASLKRMGLDYVDQVLIHWPMSISQDGIDEKIDYLDTYRGLEAVLDKGLTRSIGVSNFNLDQMKRLLANCRVKPVVLQIEVNLTLFPKDLISFCQSEDILVVSYSSFGAMTNKARDQRVPEPRLDTPAMVSMGKKYAKTVPQIVLRFLYQKGLVTIPKSITKSRIMENASIFDFEIDSTDVAKLQKYNCGFLSERPIFWQDFTNYPFEKIDAPKMEIPLSLRKWKNGANLDID